MLQPLRIGADLRRGQIRAAMRAARRASAAASGHRLHHQLDAELLRECARQPVFEALWSVRAEVVAGRRVERHDAQFAASADLLQRGLLRLRAARQRRATAARALRQTRRARAPACAMAASPPAIMLVSLRSSLG